MGTIAHSLPPGAILILGAVLLPLLPGRLRPLVMLILPVVGFAQLLLLEQGTWLRYELFDLPLAALRVDRLALLFGYIFHIAALIGAVFMLHERDPVQQVSTLGYAGAAIAALFAGDLLTLFVFWELTAVTSVCLILARRTPAATTAALRYLVVQVGSGVILLAGIILLAGQGRPLAFEHLGLIDLATSLVFLAFGIKAAFPLLHAWLPDAYPEATAGGAVVLSAFTTKLAVYALARSFAGTEALIWIGAVMAVFPMIYAMIENDLRRVLAYSLNVQLGYMVVGVGVGTELALNGAAAHAFNHIVYKALLFMAMGAVLYRVGTVKGSELGGLYRSMPWTAAFCIVGGASISAVPLFAGFVSKGLILDAAAAEGHAVAWATLLFASAGALLYIGIRVPYFAFFAEDSGKRCREAPANMLVAMAIGAALSIGIGLWPGALYALLPFPVGDYAAYSASHVIAQMQLLLFAAVGFMLLRRAGLYPRMLAGINLDVDWLYRGLLSNALGRAMQRGSAAWAAVTAWLGSLVGRAVAYLYRHHGPHGLLGQTWPSGSMVLWAAALLTACLLFFYAR